MDIRIAALLPQLNAERDLAALLELLAQAAPRLLKADRASIFLLDAAKGELYSHVALGTKRELRFDARLGVAGAAALSGETINVRAAQEDPRFYSGVDTKTGYKTRTILAVPLRTQAGESVGTFQVLNKKRGAFTADDEALLEELAGHAAVAIRNAQVVRDLARNRDRLLEENSRLRRAIKDRFATTRLLGTSERIREIVTLIEEIRDTAVTVLITGESGTGKELVAGAIHHSSLRAENEFVAVNCAALPTELIESELFGIEKGVATGVERRAGRFEQAKGGTLFLDEIGDLSPVAQAKILRALQERKIERVGGRKMIRVDVRVLAATNRDLAAAVAGGTFREDLYYRLKVVHIRTPALREVPQDIPLLADHFLTRACQEMSRPKKTLAPDARRYLRRYPWPGNVRELENEMLRAAATVRARTVYKTDLSPEITAAEVDGGEGTLKEAVAALEARMIREALRTTGQNQSRAARILGLSRQGLINKMKRYGL